MKTSALFLLLFVFAGINACTQPEKPDNMANLPENLQNTQVNQNFNQPQKPAPTGQGASDGKLKMHTIFDSKTNAPMAYMPLPQNWTVSRSAKQGTPSITGPDGLEVYSYPFKSFVSSNDPMTRQAYQYSGIQMRQPLGIAGVINQDISQMTQSYGLRFVKQYPLPLVAQNDRGYSSRLYSVGSMQKNFEVMGTEWIDSKGNPVLIVVRYIETAAAGMVSWGYSMQTLSIEKKAFQKAKNTYINALANTRYDQNHIAAYNQREASKSNRSWTAHNQKMRSNQAAFDAQQRTHRETYDAINRSSMDAYNNRSASMDRNQHALTNSIHEQSTVTDPANGQSYQVEGYSNQYWMNGNGEYIGTDNSLYNPNLDPNVNNQNWQQAPENPYGR